jgi:hypothetical protein
MSQTRVFFTVALIALVGVYAAYTSPGSRLNAWITGQCFSHDAPNVCRWHEKSHRLPNERPPGSAGRPSAGRVIVR